MEARLWKFSDRASQIDPFQQGEMDALCGIYSVVNALRWVHFDIRPISDDLSARMFRHAVKHLSKLGKLQRAVWDGMPEKTWVGLISELASFAEIHTDIKIDVSRVETKGMSDLSTRLSQRQAILAHIKGAYNHYTVIVGDKSSRWYLFDSDEMSYILHRSLKTTKERRKAKYTLTGKGTYSISICK